SLEDLACPCSSGFVCCEKVCVAEGSCGGDKLTVPGPDAAGSSMPAPSSTSSGATTSPSIAFPPSDTGTTGASSTHRGSTGGVTRSERSSASAGSESSTESSGSHLQSSSD